MATNPPGNTRPAAPASGPSTRKRSKQAPVDAALVAVLATAAQQLNEAGFPATAHVLQTEGIPQDFKANINDPLYHVHWSKNDMASNNIRTDPIDRLSLIGGLRGYRMARASNGVNSGTYYYECLLLPGPSATELLQNLPSNARLGPGLKEQLQAAVDWEQQQQQQPSSTKPTETTKKRKTNNDRPPNPGGHVRLGWSMRTADLQAPVGYDKWSYAIRSINGSLVHNSQRQDYWGGEKFEPNDVIGCCINFDNKTIRFFKNGNCMGKFAIVKGKLDGGVAFSDITPGTYYPAVSCYLGGSVRANFGPHWICPPKKSKLNLNIEPISSLREPPKDAEEAVERISSTIKLFKKVEHQNAVKSAVRDEAIRQREAHEKFFTRHVEEIKKLRVERGASIHDLPSPTSD